MRAVLDTNVFLSGIHWAGASSKVLSAWFLNKFTLVSSMEINRELFTQLRDFKIRMETEEIHYWESLVPKKSELVVPNKKIEIVKDDPDDNKFIETALEGKAEYIVTQDKHLLKIKEFKGIKIITPEEFIKLFE